MRLSYVGELGWELYTTADHGPQLWDTLWERARSTASWPPAAGAFNSLRLEKGYRSLGADMTYEHDPYEAGLGFAVKLDKGDFVGRDALVRRKQQGAPGSWPASPSTSRRRGHGQRAGLVDGRAVGYVTSAAYGYTIDKGIAYAWLPAELAEPGQAAEIAYFDRRLPATVNAEPLFDPQMQRLRS